MNRVTISKYTDFHRIAGNLSSSTTELDKLYITLLPYLQKIDAMEESVNKLEQAAYKLDSYSKKLEAKFKYLEKRWFSSFWLLLRGIFNLEFLFFVCYCEIFLFLFTHCIYVLRKKDNKFVQRA